MYNKECVRINTISL